MADKEIHELSQIGALGGGDRLLVSREADNATRHATIEQLPVVPVLPGAVARLLHERLAESVSAKDFGAVGDGVADDAEAINKALASGADVLLIPSGTYRLTEPLVVPPLTRLAGAGQHATRLVVDHDGIAIEASGAEVIDVQIESLRLELGAQSAGIRLTGNEVVVRDVFFTGGDPTKWALELLDCNIAHIVNLRMGGNGDREFTANGILWRSSDPLNNPVNYGDGTIQGCDLKLGAANTVGIHLKGEEGNLVNNVMIAKVQIVAPETGTTPFAGTTALILQSVARCTLVSVDMEAIETGVHEIGYSNTAGGNVFNQYMGVFALNVGTAYVDSNEDVTRSVRQRTFIGCDNFPDMAGMIDGDTVIPAGLWIQSYVTGNNSVRLRSFTTGELILDNGADSGALSLVVGGSSPKLAPLADDGLGRLYLGKSSSASNPRLRDVTVEPVLRLTPLSEPNYAPTDGQIAYADGTNWDPGQGAGFYMREAGAWRKVAFAS